MVRYEKIGGGDLLRLNRPEVLNGLNRQIMTESGAVIDDVAEGEGEGALVIVGTGKGFRAGADLAAHDERPGIGPRTGPHRWQAARRDGH